MLSGRGFCEGPFTYPEKSNRLRCVCECGCVWVCVWVWVCECDLETSVMRRPKPTRAIELNKFVNRPLRRTDNSFGKVLPDVCELESWKQGCLDQIWFVGPQRKNVLTAWPAAQKRHCVYASGTSWLLHFMEIIPVCCDGNRDHVSTPHRQHAEYCFVDVGDTYCSYHCVVNGFKWQGWRLKSHRENSMLPLI